MDNIDFEIIETPVYYGDLKTESESHKAIVRSDNNDLLSIMKNSYKPLYVNQFKEITNRLQKTSGFEFSGYSQFNGGRIILSYLKNNRRVKSINGFEMKDYMTIGSSFDGKTSTFIGASNIMIRCMNVWSQISKTNKFRHTISAESKIEEFLLSIEEYFTMQEKMYEEFDIWNNIKIKSDTVESAIKTIVDWDEEEDNSTKKINKANLLKKCAVEETTVLGDNLFGLFQSFTKYSTHYMNQKNKVFGNIVGSSANFNNKAYDIVKKLEYSL